MTATQTRHARQDALRNRERVLRAAEQLFAQKGMEASVEEIARAAGVGMGTLYRHFATKDLLVNALVDDTVAALIETAERCLLREDGAGLECFLVAAGQVQASNRGSLPRLWSLDTEAEPLQHLRQITSRLLTDAKRHGRVRAELAETDITMILWSIRGVIETAGDVAPDAWQRHLSLLIAALRPSDSRLAHAPLTREQVRRIVVGS